MPQIQNEVSSDLMPLGAPLSPRQKKMLLDWISEGAPEFGDKPTPPPPMLLPAFASIHDLVLVPYCIACHSPGNPGKRVPLNTLDDLLNSPLGIVLPGNPDESDLVIAVRRTDKKRMPPPNSGVQSLSSDQISVIVNWISNGAKEY